MSQTQTFSSNILLTNNLQYLFRQIKAIILWLMFRQLKDAG